MSENQDVHSAARFAATLRTVLAGFREGGDRALPLLVGEQEGGEPEAVILPYDLFKALCRELEHAEDVAIGDLAVRRLADAPAPGKGWTPRPWPALSPRRLPTTPTTSSRPAEHED